MGVQSLSIYTLMFVWKVCSGFQSTQFYVILWWDLTGLSHLLKDKKTGGLFLKFSQIYGVDLSLLYRPCDHPSPPPPPQLSLSCCPTEKSCMRGPRALRGIFQSLSLWNVCVCVCVISCLISLQDPSKMSLSAQITVLSGTPPQSCPSEHSPVSSSLHLLRLLNYGTMSPLLLYMVIMSVIVFPIMLDYKNLEVRS